MKHDVAGDPISGLKWTRKTVAKISNELAKLGIYVSGSTVSKLLKKMKFSLKTNKKIVACGTKTSAKDKEDRNQQFNYINKLRSAFAEKGIPVLSIDAKKKELIGNFKNAGRTWEKEAHSVNDHDYPSDASGKATPYGIYDTTANQGMVNLGISSDTGEFAVDSIVLWWKKIGSEMYGSNEILILADSGGSNGARLRLFKYNIQEKLCDQLGLKVTVCHYPTGTSKWNPIEHRLFSQISKNWAGEPLDSLEKALKFIRTTKTSTGLKVKSFLSKKIYKKGIKITKKEMEYVNIERHNFFPNLNYTISSL